MKQKYGLAAAAAVVAIAAGGGAGAQALYVVGEKAKVEKVLSGGGTVCAPTVESLPGGLNHVRPPVDEIARSLSVDYCDAALVESDVVGAVLADAAAMRMALEVQDYSAPAPAPLAVARAEPASSTPQEDPVFAEAYRALSAGDATAAASLFAEGLETQPNDQAANYYLGSAYERMGRDDYAAVQYRRVIRNWPDSPEAAAASQALKRSTKSETLLAQAPPPDSISDEDGSGFFDSIMKVFDSGEEDAPPAPAQPNAPALAPPIADPPAVGVDEAEINYADGAQYVGDVLSDQPHGQGRMTYAGGARYEGGFREGLRSGDGRLALTDGLVYEGGFTRDVINGQGRIRWPDGATYEGDFVMGARTGDGVYVWPSGARYQGRFEDGVIVGPGIFVAQSGERYEGEFQNGRRTGRGVLTLPNGERIEGNFVDGQLVRP